MEDLAVHEQCRIVATDAIKVVDSFKNSSFKGAYLREVPSLLVCFMFDTVCVFKFSVRLSCFLLI